MVNSLQNLIDHGIDEYTANRMLSEYRQRIGTMNGIYKIVDINYDFDVRGKDITLECSKCGNVIHRTMINGRNKWSELIKSCSCQKEEERRQKQIAFENSKRIKREKILSDAQSMIGDEYGDYEIKDFEFRNDIPKFVIKCKTCGHVTTVHYRSVKTNAKYPWECREHRVQTPIKYDESYIGRKKNFLTVVGVERNEKNRKLFVCECDCGNIKRIEPAAWELELVKSCGCKKLELLSEANKKENPLSEMRLYHVYVGMKDRCYNPNSNNYKNYGGRGIIICDEWINDFWKFHEWAYANGYDENAERGECTIERKDVNGNYESSNCEWITIQQQQKNKRPSNEWENGGKLYTINGETKILTAWCKQYNTSTVAVNYRMKKMGMTLEEALKTPKMTMGRPRKEQII